MRVSKPKYEGLVIRDDERSEIKPVERVSRLGMSIYTSRQFESIVGLLWGHYGHFRLRLGIRLAGSWRIMPDLRAFSGSGRAELEQSIHLPCLGDFKGHIGPVNALPDSAPKLTVTFLGKARAGPAQIYNLQPWRYKGGARHTDKFKSLVRLRRVLRVSITIGESSRAIARPSLRNEMKP